jgi:hypothetical protein
MPDYRVGIGFGQSLDLTHAMARVQGIPACAGRTKLGQFNINP